MSNAASYAALTRLTRRMDALSSGRVLTEMATAMGREALTLTDDAFTSQADPYGRPWAPRKRPRPWPKLDRSGRLRGAFRLRVFRYGFRITNATPYGIYHQRGTKRMARRLMLPTGSRLPAAYRRAFYAVAYDAFYRALR